MKISNFIFYGVLSTTAFFMTGAQAGVSRNDLLITDAWVQDMPPSEKTTAAYMAITNNSQRQAVLASATCDMAAAVEIHQMSEKNGMMSMARVSHIGIPSHGRVTLEPGGFHIMLINLKKPVIKGDMVPITLHFQDGSVMIVNAQVKSPVEDDSSGIPGMKI